MKKVWNFFKSRWRLWLYSLFIGIIFGVVVNILWGDPNLSYALVALGTLLLAVATVSLIYSNRKLVQQRIESEQAKERRERDIGFLNEIIEWAVNIVKIGIPAQSIILVSSMDDKSERRLIQNTLLTMTNDFRASVASSLYVCKIVLAFGEKLKSSVNNLDTAIRNQNKLINKCIETSNRRALSEFNKAWNELMDNWNKIGDSAANVIDEAVLEKFIILNI